MLIRLLFTLFILSCCSFTLAQDDGNTDTAETSETSTDESSETDLQSNKIVSVRYLCELQGLTRRVEVDYESSESSVPCSVNYYKDTEAPGETNTLWSAGNIEGYCEEKAAGFIDKLKSWGWSCSGG